MIREEIFLFFLKKEPKTLALRGFNSLNLLLFFKELKSTGSLLAPKSQQFKKGK
jgi:hypothetical protein